MNIREKPLFTRATASPSTVARETRKRRTFGIDALQQLEGRQLLASFSATYSAAVPAQTTDYTAPVSLPQFNPSLGTLTSISLTLTSSGTQQGTLTNVASGPETFGFQENVNVALSDSSGTTLLAPNLTNSQSYVFLAPNTPAAFGPFSPTSSTSAQYTSGAIFNEFEGTSSIPLNLTTLTSTTTTGGGGNIRSVLTTTAGATATVTYTYTANPVTLAGHVYEDQFNNGVLSPGDPPIPGVTIELLNSSGAIVATTTTAADGTYSFSTDSNGGLLYPGSYSIDELPPSGFLPGAVTPGTPGNGVASPAAISSIVLTSGQNSVGNNFGELLPVSLSGNVYDDAAGLGVIAPGDPPIGGVTLTLVNSTGNIVATTLTSDTGKYLFTTTTSGALIGPGTYTIDETQPFRYLQGSNTVGTVNGVTVGALTGVDQIGDIILFSGQNSINNNFGEVLPVSISGTVYDDVHKAGAFVPGVLPIPGVTLRLYSSIGLVATTTTNAFGVYSFTTTATGAPLPPSLYTLIETQPAGFAQGTNTVGSVNGVTDGVQASQDVFVGISLKSGQSSVNNNFGEILNVPSPTITSVERFGVHNQPTLIYLTFSTPLDPATAQNVANYQIFGPTDANSPAPVPIKSAHYDPATNSVTLQLGERLQVHHPYTLTVNGVTSSTGAPLNGSNGAAGTPYVTTLDRATLAGFTDIYGNFVPINHGQLYPAASSAGYKHTRFVPPAKLGSFAPANTAAFRVATSPIGEIPPIALKGIKPLPPAKGGKFLALKVASHHHSR